MIKVLLLKFSPLDFVAGNGQSGKKDFEKIDAFAGRYHLIISDAKK